MVAGVDQYACRGSTVVRWRHITPDTSEDAAGSSAGPGALPLDSSGPPLARIQAVDPPGRLNEIASPVAAYIWTSASRGGAAGRRTQSVIVPLGRGLRDPFDAIHGPDGKDPVSSTCHSDGRHCGRAQLRVGYLRSRSGRAGETAEQLATRGNNEERCA